MRISSLASSPTAAHKRKHKVAAASAAKSREREREMSKRKSRTWREVAAGATAKKIKKKEGNKISHIRVSMHTYIYMTTSHSRLHCSRVFLAKSLSLSLNLISRSSSLSALSKDAFGRLGVGVLRYISVKLALYILLVQINARFCDTFVPLELGIMRRRRLRLFLSTKPLLLSLTTLTCCFRYIYI